MSVQRQNQVLNVCNTQHFSSSSSHSANPLTLQWGELEGQFVSLRSSIEARLKELEIKETQVNDRLKELETKEKETVKLRFCVDVDGDCAHMDWKKLLNLLNESTDEQEKLYERVCLALELSQEPGKLVLDAVRELYRESEDLGFVNSARKRSCVVLLEQLVSLAPKIVSEVKMEALELAREWKAKMEMDKGEKGVLDVVGFLLLLSAYDIVHNFNIVDILRVFHDSKNQDRRVRAGNSSVVGDRASTSLVSQEKTGSSLEEDLELVNHIASTFISPFEALKYFCVGMNGRSLKLFLYQYVDENDSWSTRVHDALSHASDPAKLVLDAIPGFVCSRHENLLIAKVRNICIILLEQLMIKSPPISPEVREEALKLAEDWEYNLVQVYQSPQTAYGFLLFLAAYGLNSKYEANELVPLLEVSSQHKACPRLSQALGLADKVEEIVQKLIQKGMLLDAVDRVCAYNLVGKFQPVDLLKNYLNSSVNKIYQKGKMSSLQQTMDKEIAVIKSIIRYVAKYKLETNYPIEDLEKQILELEKKKVQMNGVQMKRPKAYQKRNFPNPSLSCASTSLDFQAKVTPKENLKFDNQVKFKLRPKEDLQLDDQETKGEPSPKEDLQSKNQVAKTQISSKEDFQSNNKMVSPKEDLQMGNQASSSSTSHCPHLKSLFISICGRYSSFFSNSHREKLDSMNHSSASLWPELKAFCVDVDGKGLSMFLYDHIDEHNLLCNEVREALKYSPDPSKLVLDAMPGFLLSQPEFDKNLSLNKVRNCRILLLEILITISPPISPCVKEVALKMANEWRANLGQKYKASVNVYGFLSFIAAYGLTSNYKDEELLDLLLQANRHKPCPGLCRILGLAEKVVVLIENLIQKTLLLEAVEHIYEFDLADKFPPVRLMKDYLYSQKTVHKNKTKSPSKHAIDKEIVAARSIINCIAKYKLESQYPPEDLEKHIAELEKQRANVNDIFTGKSQS